MKKLSMKNDTKFIYNYYNSKETKAIYHIIIKKQL